jgi:hypothetical protein
MQVIEFKLILSIKLNKSNILINKTLSSILIIKYLINLLSPIKLIL